MQKYDVQVRVGGEWRWAGVEPMGMTLRAARLIAVRTGREIQSGSGFWATHVGATAVRIAKLPSSTGWSDEAAWR